MDRIVLKDLRLSCIIGAIDHERHQKQEVLVTLSLWTDLSFAGKTDRLGDTIDYKKLSDRLVSMVEKSSYFLIEALAEKIAELCLEDPKTQKVQVLVEKPAALPLASAAGVEIMRGRADMALDID